MPKELILSTVSSPDSLTATEALDNNHIKIQAACWSCDGLVRKLVPRKSRSHQHFLWNCDTCEVTWEGPGTPKALS